MPHFDHPVIDEVVALQLPYPEEVVIGHGAALAIRGVRGEHLDGDIDFATSLENILFLRNELGWRAASMVVGMKKDGTPKTIIASRDSENRFDGHRWDFSMPRYRRTGKGRMYLPELGARSEQDDRSALWIATLELIRETKEETGRQKDEEDIRTIDNIL